MSTLLIVHEQGQRNKFYKLKWVQENRKLLDSARKVSGIYMDAEDTDEEEEAAFDLIIDFLNSEDAKACQLNEREEMNFFEFIAIGV